jgi:hypothetical protein
MKNVKYKIKIMMSKFKFLSILALIVVNSTYGQTIEPSDSLFHRVMLFNWVDTLDVSAQSEVIELFKGMPDKIDGFESIEVNETSKSNEGYDHVLILRFRTKKGLETYEKHPDHLRIQEIAPPLVSGFLLYEYWRKTE